MKSSLILALIMLIGLASNEANTVQGQSTSEITAKQPIKKKVWVDPGGFISLPEGYKAFRLPGFIDAWFGYIESADGKVRINFGAGIVESLFDKYKDKFVWTKIEQTLKQPVKFGLMRNKKEEKLVARTGWIEFSGPGTQEIEKNIFREIVYSYRRETCKDCHRLPYKEK